MYKIRPFAERGFSPGGSCWRLLTKNSEFPSNRIDLSEVLRIALRIVSLFHLLWRKASAWTNGLLRLVTVAILHPPSSELFVQRTWSGWTPIHHGLIATGTIYPGNQHDQENRNVAMGTLHCFFLDASCSQAAMPLIGVARCESIKFRLVKMRWHVMYRVSRKKVRRMDWVSWMKMRKSKALRFIGVMARSCHQVLWDL